MLTGSSQEGSSLSTAQASRTARLSADIHKELSDIFVKTSRSFLADSEVSSASPSNRNSRSVARDEHDWPNLAIADPELKTSDYPKQASEITIEWIHDILARSRVMTNVRIASVKIQRRSRDRPLFGVHLGCTAVRAVVDLIVFPDDKEGSSQLTRSASYSDASEKEQTKRGPTTDVVNLIIKFLPRQPAHIALACDEMKMFQREVEFYSAVVPDMMNYLMSKDENHAQFLSMIPKCYFAAMDENLRGGCIVLKDPGSHSVVPGDLQYGLPLEKIQVVLKELALFHAVSFALDAHEKGWFNKYKFMVHRRTPHHVLTSTVGYATKIASEGLAAAGALDSKTARYMRQLVDSSEMLENYETTQGPDERLSVLCHGDLWLNSIFFKSTPRELLITDYHLVQFSHPACDLVLFLYTSFGASDRPGKMSNLLKFYYDLLEKHIRFFTGIQITNIEPYEDFVARFVQYTQDFGIPRLCLSIPLSLVDHSDFADALETCEDLDAFKQRLIAQFHLSNTSVFRIITRLSSVLNEICVAPGALVEQLLKRQA
jgi:hypothetical protein